MYTISPYPQQSPEWELIVVVSSTDLGYLMGHDYQSLIKGTREPGWERVREKFRLGRRIKIPSNPDLERGIRCEPLVRKRLESYLQQYWPIEIREIGLATLNRQPLFGTSVDGLIFHRTPEGPVESEWCIEIKCLRKMYDDLQGPITLTPSFEHIKRDHYDQMQWHCFILGKQGCFYTVFIEDTTEMFIQYVPRNPEYIAKMEATATEFLKALGKL